MVSSKETLWRRVEQLRGTPYLELCRIPPYQEESIECNDGHIKLAIWKDEFIGSEIRIIVQAYRPGIIVGMMQAAGFRSTPNEVKELQKGDLSEFC